MNNKNRPPKKRVYSHHAPLSTVEDWREFMKSVFGGGDNLDDADIFARYAVFLCEAIEQQKYQLVKDSLSSAIVAAKEFGRFPQIEMKFYEAYLLGDLKPEYELRFRGGARRPRSGNGSRLLSLRKKR